MANLIIDIGNTALKAAWADGVTLGKTFRYQGERIMDFILSLTSKVKADTMIISTAREFSSRNISSLEKECSCLLLLDSRHTEIHSKYNLPLYLSPDRLASIVASTYLFRGKPVTLFDFGTTLTVDFISAEGRFLGGNISLGCRTRFKSINRYSKTLPLLNAPEMTVDYSNDIKSSIENGIIQGIIFEVEGYLSRYSENISVFTGGDAIYFAKRMKNSIFVVSNLVLMGLAIIADEYDKDIN